MYYGKPSIALYVFHDTDGRPHVRTILCREGTRMGCVLGSLGFDLAVDLFIYRPLTSLFGQEEVTMRALTDDLHRVWEPPPTNSLADWETTFDRIASFKAEYDKCAGPIGLARHPTKAAIVLPTGAPLPSSLRRSNGISLIIKPGVLIAGRPVGSPEFLACGLNKILDKATSRIQDVLTLAPKEPLLAAKVLAVCANKMLDYHAGIIPLADFDPVIEAFDSAIIKAEFQILTPPNQATYPCSDGRRRRAETLMSLPQRSGGIGLVPLAAKAPAALLRSIIAVADERALHDRSALAAPAEAAYHRVCQLLKIDAVSPEHPLAPFLPPDPRFLTSGTFAASFSSTHTNCKVQKVISAQVMHQARLDLRASVSGPSLPDDVTTSDAAHILAVTTRCTTTRLLSGSSWRKLPSLLPGQFIAWQRFHLNLPQIPVWGDHAQHPGGYACDICRGKHRPEAHDNQDPTHLLLDATGDHCCSCPTSFGARYGNHNSLARTLRFAARQAGASATTEPPTASLLGFTYSADQCAVLFPRKVNDITKASSKAIENLLNLLPSIDELGLRNLVTNELDRLTRSAPSDGKGLRVDLRLFDDNPGASSELWLDCACIHGTTKLERAGLLASLRTEQAADPPAPPPPTARSHTTPTALAPTPPVTSAAKTKIDRYAPLLQRGLQLFALHKLPRLPQFIPCIATHAGELGAGLLSVVEWLCKCYRKNSAPAYSNMMGVSHSVATACFRSRTLDAIAVSMASGWASQLLSVGYPLAFADY